MENPVEQKEAPAMSETKEFSEAEVVEEYQRLSIQYKMFEKWLSNGDNQIAQIEMNIELIEFSVQRNDWKMDQYERIFDQKDVNVEKRIKKIREKYSDMELLAKAKVIIEETVIDFEEVDGKIMQTTKIVNSIEDLLIEFMNLMTSKPDLLQKVINEKDTLDKSKSQKERTEKNQIQIKERLGKIKALFESRGQDINKLLDQAAATRRAGNKVAQNLPAVEEPKEDGEK